MNDRLTLFVASSRYLRAVGLRPYWDLPPAQRTPNFRAITPGTGVNGLRADVILVHPSTFDGEPGRMVRDWIRDSLECQLASPDARLVYL